MRASKHWEGRGTGHRHSPACSSNWRRYTALDITGQWCPLNELLGHLWTTVALHCSEYRDYNYRHWWNTGAESRSWNKRCDNTPSYTHHGEWWWAFIKSFILTLFNTAYIFFVRYILSKCATNSSRCQRAKLFHFSLYPEQSSWSHLRRHRFYSSLLTCYWMNVAFITVINNTSQHGLHVVS